VGDIWYCYKAILKAGIKFIKEEANLSGAKVLINNYVACNDVFITKMDQIKSLFWVG
jgi:hypothetical protein